MGRGTDTKKPVPYRVLAFGIMYASLRFNIACDDFSCTFVTGYNNPF
jgi:hypothetical protein